MQASLEIGRVSNIPVLCLLWHPAGTCSSVKRAILNSGFLLVNLDLSRCWQMWGEFYFLCGNFVREQYSLLDTIFNYMCYFGPPGKYLWTSKGNRPGRRVVGFGDLSIDMFLEVQNKTYIWILYLIDCIAYGPKFRHQQKTHHSADG